MVAPDRERSGVGTAVTLQHPLRVHQVLPLEAGVIAYAVEGTPADAVILALRSLFPAPPAADPQAIDVLVAGINQGANLGNDALISGTVGAALQGHLLGRPALALSVQALKEPLWAPAATLARFLAERLRRGLLPGDLLLNVNLPNLPLAELKGVAMTRLGRHGYVDLVETTQDGKGRTLYWIRRGKLDSAAEPGSDVWALRQGMASITPLRRDLTADPRLGDLGELGMSLYQELCPRSP